MRKKNISIQQIQIFNLKKKILANWKCKELPQSNKII